MLFRVALWMFPSQSSRFFETCAGATVVSWVTSNNKEDAIVRTVDELKADGLLLRNVIEVLALSLDDASQKEEHLARRARIGGFACDVALQRRYYVNTAREVFEAPLPQLLRPAFEAFCRAVERSGSVYTLRASDDFEYAETSILEQDARPFWDSEVSMSDWSRDWPEDFVPWKMPVTPTFRQVLHEVEAREQMLALGLANTLVLFDPAELVTEFGGPQEIVHRYRH